jgi:hypothetical protein
MQKRQTLVIGFVITNKWSVVGFLFTCRNQNLDLISYVSVFISKMKFILKFILIGADNIIRVKNMEISAYQINNVLRVYGEQLRQSLISNQPEDTDTNAPHRIDISAKARRETIIEDITSNMIERITQFGPGDNVEKEVFKKLESEHGKPLAINEDRHNELIFKEIDGNGETINSLSIEDSKFLTNKLKDITKESAEKK